VVMNEYNDEFTLSGRSVHNTIVRLISLPKEK